MVKLNKQDFYTEFTFKVQPKEPWADILLAHLQVLAFESFLETQEGFQAYALQNSVTEEMVNEVLQILPEAKVSYQNKIIEKTNWNHEWESNFKPISIGKKCHIRADFHPNQQGFDYQIIIQPKMSFGTGHHATTHLIVEFLLEIKPKNTTVLDMGCGTAILAILAKMRGASVVKAIDIDDWAVENAKENAIKNSVEISVELGDASVLGKESYDLILANINKNVLLQDIPTYVANLNKNGKLILSGLLNTDFDEILNICQQNGLNFAQKKQREEWIAILFEN